jgi:hypothetical protein
LNVKQQLLVVIAGRLATALITLAGLRIATHFLAPEQYGVLALIVAVQMLCGLFLVNPVGQHLNLNTHAWWDDGTLLPRLRSYRSFIGVVSLIGGGVAAFALPHDDGLSVALAMFAAFWVILAGTWNTTLIPMLNMLNYRTESAIWSVITALTSLVFSVGLVWWHPTATVWVIGQSIGLLIGALGARAALIQRVEPAHAPNKTLPLLDRTTLYGYCIPVAIANGFMWLQLSGYRFEIELYWGLAELGYLAIGIQIASQIGALAESLAMQFLFPMFYRRCSEHQNKAEVSSALSDLLNTLAPLYFVLIGSIAAGAPYLLTVLVAGTYRSAANYLVIGAVIEGCRMVANLLGVTSHIMRQPRYLALPYALGSLCTFILITMAGQMSLSVFYTVLAVAAGSMTMLLAMWVNTKRLTSLAVDRRRWILALVWMVLLPIVFQMASTTVTLLEAIAFLAAIGSASGVVVAVLLYRNEALLRLVQVDMGKVAP